MDLHTEELYAAVRQLRDENQSLRRNVKVMAESIRYTEGLLAELASENARLRQLYPAHCGD